MIKNEEQLKTARGMHESICPEETISNCFSSSSDKIEQNYDNTSLDRKQISDGTKFENVGENMQTKFDMARTKMRDWYPSYENKRNRIQVIESQDFCGNIIKEDINFKNTCFRKLLPSTFHFLLDWFVH